MMDGNVLRNDALAHQNEPAKMYCVGGVSGGCIQCVPTAS